MKLSLFGRSDLIRVMQAEDPELEAAVARFLGLELKPEPPPEPIPYIPQKDIVLSEPEPTPELLVSDMSEPVPFLVPVSFTAFHPLDTELEPEPDHEPGVPSPENQTRHQSHYRLRHWEIASGINGATWSAFTNNIHR